MFPILPLIIINRTNSIGSTCNSRIFPYNTIDIAENIKQKLEGNEFGDFIPYFNDYGGQIEKISDVSYKTFGKWNRLTDLKILVTKLLIDTSSQEYEMFLERLKEENKI